MLIIPAIFFRKTIILLLIKLEDRMYGEAFMLFSKYFHISTFWLILTSESLAEVKWTTSHLEMSLPVGDPKCAPSLWHLNQQGWR